MVDSPNQISPSFPSAWLHDLRSAMAVVVQTLHRQCFGVPPRPNGIRNDKDPSDQTVGCYWHHRDVVQITARSNSALSPGVGLIHSHSSKSRERTIANAISTDHNPLCGDSIVTVRNRFKRRTEAVISKQIFDMTRPTVNGDEHVTKIAFVLSTKSLGRKQEIAKVSQEIGSPAIRPGRGQSASFSLDKFSSR
jgi:hypothetical protein